MAGTGSGTTQLDFVKLERFDGAYFKRWKTKMLFLLARRKVCYVLITPKPAANEDKTVIRKWEEDDYICKGEICNALSDTLFDVYQDMEGTAKALWDALHAKYEENENRISSAPRDQKGNYLPLYKAILRGDWESAKKIFEKDEGALTAEINPNSESALDVAVGTGNSVHFVEKLVEMMSVEALEKGHKSGNTALHNAALFDNTKAAKILVEKHWALLYVHNNYGMLPIHRAARSGHTKTFSYLWSITKDDKEHKLFEGQSGVLLLLLVIQSEFYDVALDLVHRYPELAQAKLDITGKSTSEVMTRKSAVESTSEVTAVKSDSEVSTVESTSEVTAGKSDSEMSTVTAGKSASEVITVESTSEVTAIKSDSEVTARKFASEGKSALEAIDGKSALEVIAGKKSTFASGSRLNFWQRLIYKYVHVKFKYYAEDHNRGDIVIPVNCCQVIAEQHPVSESQKLQAMLWKVFESLVPSIKWIREQKLMHLQARQLVKCLCEKILSADALDASASLASEAILKAARIGNHEVIEEIVDSFPSQVWATDSERHNIFQLAVIHRCENVFNLIYQMSEHKHSITQAKDASENTILHLAGRLAPPNTLSLISGAALQMQRELQWFKEVEKFVQPIYKESKNKDNETPATVFTREHKELLVQGEKWMKETSYSCTIIAALIATVVFAAAITVPGGNNGGSGLPILYREKAFIIFAVSDAISLFTSTNSLIMFMLILTSSYAEGDFLKVLPIWLIIGLSTLFLSLTSMMIAFSSTLYLVFGHRKAWILIPVAAFGCVPIAFFVCLQFPLLMHLISSTWGHNIFGKKSDRPFY